MAVLKGFQRAWLLDFEFHQPTGETPDPICLVAIELRSGRVCRWWADELRAMQEPPIDVGPDSLVVAYFAAAELSCFLALGWSMPARVLDLFAEFRCLTNGLPVPCGNGLLGAMTFFGLDPMGAVEKEEMRQLAMRGGPYTAGERAALLDYCQRDVEALAQLLLKMLPRIDLPRALLRGRYAAAIAAMESIGIPIDTATLQRLRTHWADIRGALVQRVDADFGVYDGLTFRHDRFAAWLARRGIAWPFLDSGRLALDDDMFRRMARTHAEVEPLRELRQALGQMRLFDGLAVGHDGRNRCMLSPFRSKTARNQPSNSKFIFGASAWLRSLIRPGPGQALAYIDWEQQEFGVAAALSGDRAMMEAYASGDPYLAFARQAGAVPQDATKQSHPREREQFKLSALAVQYGMGADRLAESLNVPVARGRELLQLHRETYPAYWRWSDAAVDHAMLYGKIPTVLGWYLHVGQNVNRRSIANFPSQANGAETLRLACCLATERGIAVCAPVHDALLIEAALGDIEKAVAETEEAMREASRIVLGGFELRTDAKVVRWPARYVDDRGRTMWDTVMELLDQQPDASAARAATCPTVGHRLSHRGTPGPSNKNISYTYL